MGALWRARIEMWAVVGKGELDSHMTSASGDRSLDRFFRPACDPIGWRDLPVDEDDTICEFADELSNRHSAAAVTGYFGQ
jgi:hypothetical protein